MKEITLYRCEICGNIVCMVEDSGVVPVCCGQEMRHLAAGSADASREKHVPVSLRSGSRVQVTVGETAHPMLPGHHIEWILMLTDRSVYARSLNPAGLPEAVFDLRADEVPVSVYAFCNLHGLWIKNAVSSTEAKNERGKQYE